MSKKTFTVDELEQFSAEEIIAKIQNENYSLLTSLGAEDLRKEMVPVGKVCRMAAAYFLSTGPKSARKRLVRVLRKLAPADYKKSDFVRSKNGLVIGFNHPSLGEILRLVLMKMDILGEKPMLFPVNLPWYEAMAKDYSKMLQLGIIIVPTITPSTWKKMNLKQGTAIYEAANNIKHAFRELYVLESHRVVKEGGIIFVAPSATRQATVFKNKDVFDKKEDIIPTMSMLAKRLYADPKMHCDFLAVSILPPKNYKRGLNLTKVYKLIPSELITAKEIRKKYFKTKNPEKLEGFDYDFHQKLANNLPKDFWY